MEKGKFKFGIGIKVWISICIFDIVLSSLLGTYIVYDAYADFNYFITSQRPSFMWIFLNNMIYSPVWILTTVTNITIVASYIWLLIGKRRCAFFFIVLLKLIQFIGTIAAPDDVSVGIMALGFIMPIITFVVLLKYWRQMN